MVYAVIGLPDGLFLNTQIPVSVIVFRKYSDNIFFADASRDFKKEGKQNRLRQQDLDKIIGSFKHRLSTTKYSNVVDLKIVEENDYNLNIPRYVDTYEPPELPDLKELSEDIIRIKKEVRSTEKELAKMLKEVVATDEKDRIAIEKYIEVLEV